MTDEQFEKGKYTDSMELNYICPRTGDVIECLLTGINFDERIFFLTVVPNEKYVDWQLLTVNHSHVEFPKKKLKVVS
jgi:hypothetical protein